MGLFVQEPFSSLSVWPCCAGPEIVGSVLFTGGGGTIAAVADESAGLPAPIALLAVSCALSVCPTSAPTATYVWLVAPAMAAQPSPLPSQRSHW